MTTRTASPEFILTLSGPQLVATYEQVLGREPKPRQPAPSMRKQIIAALQTAQPELPAAVAADHVEEVSPSQEAAEAARQDRLEDDADDLCGGCGEEPNNCECQAEESDPDEEAAAEHERSMKAARNAVARGAVAEDTNALVSLYQSGAIERDVFDARMARLVDKAQADERAARAEDAEDDAKAERASARAASRASAAPKAAAAAAAKPGRAAELPPVGTVLRKVDRHGGLVASCRIVSGDHPVVLDDGRAFTSLTAAARALGKQGSGVKFWGLDDASTSKTPRVPATARPFNTGKVVAAFGAYLAKAEAAIPVAASSGGNPDSIGELAGLLRAQRDAVQLLVRAAEKALADSCA